MAQYYLSLVRERVGRNDERLVLTMWAVSVLLGLVHVTAEPILHDHPQLPAEGLVRVLQAMFVPGLPVVTSKRMVVVVSEQFYNFLFYDNPRLSFSLCVCNPRL